jgi:hypothetical protein
MKGNHARNHSRRTAGLERGSLRTTGKLIFDANPALLDLPCGIGGAANVQEFVRHIWGAELRWASASPACRNAARKNARRARSTRSSTCIPGHRNLPQPAGCRARANWSDPMTLDFDWLPPEQRTPSRGERSRGTRSSTASAIGRNWLHWSAPPASPRDFKATCSSVLRWRRLSLRL